MRRIVPVVSLVAALVVLGACGGGSDGGGGGGPGPVLAISKGSPASGDAQQDTVTAVLPTPLRVIVTEDGVAKAGVVVDWAAVDGQVAQPQSTTDNAGFATMTWTLGTSKGTQAASASLAGAAGSPVSFSATAFAGAPVTIANGGGEDQIVEVNGVFGVLQAWVADQYGNGIPGVIVNWAAQSGPVIPAGATAVTNSGGFSIMGVGAGAIPGAAVVRANTAGIPGTNIDYSLLVVPLPRQVNASGNPTNKFTSVTNATVNPAIDTVVVGQAVKWNQVSGVHSVNSTGAPSFVDSPNLGASGYTYRFLAVGTYQYNCGIHGNLMTGTVEVIP